MDVEDLPFPVPVALTTAPSSDPFSSVPAQAVDTSPVRIPVQEIRHQVQSQKTDEMQFNPEPEPSVCGLCKIAHKDNCIMTSSSQNLADYRYMLLVHADDEPLEQRVGRYSDWYNHDLTNCIARGHPSH